MRIRLEIVTLGLLCAACGTSITYAPTNTSPVPARPKAATEVQVFTSTRPARPYVEIGVIEARQSSGYSVDDMPDIVAKMRVDAGQRGCDALVLTSSADEVVGDKNGTATLKGYRASCVVYTGPEVAQAAAAAPATATTACVPNATQLCYGPGGCRGGQSCLPDGQSYSVCDCGGQASQSDAATAPATSVPPPAAAAQPAIAIQPPAAASGAAP